MVINIVRDNTGYTENVNVYNELECTSTMSMTWQYLFSASIYTYRWPYSYAMTCSTDPLSASFDSSV